jgi:hypothetical protein
MTKRLLLGAVVVMLLVPNLGPAQDYSGPAVQSILSAFMSYADLRLRSVQQSVEILASTAEARSGDWDQMRHLLAGYQASDGGLVVWYVRPDGTYYTVDKGLMDVSLKDRSYFPDLIAGSKITGVLVISKSTGQRSAVIAIPIKEGDEVIGAIGASLFLDKLSDQVGAILALEPGTSYFALSLDGLTTLHSEADRHFLDPRQLGSDSLKSAAEAMLSGTGGEVTYEFDNSLKKAVYMVSPLTQWRFAISMRSEGSE